MGHGHWWALVSGVGASLCSISTTSGSLVPWAEVGSGANCPISSPSPLSLPSPPQEECLSWPFCPFELRLLLPLLPVISTAIRLLSVFLQSVITSGEPWSLLCSQHSPVFCSSVVHLHQRLMWAVKEERGIHVQWINFHSKPAVSLCSYLDISF